MRRIDDRTVQLTDEELEASRRWDHFLDEGAGIHEATAKVALEFPNLSADFLDYLNN